jgi:dsDNA-specific endonuclease/ATPase MutS2
MIQRTLGEPFRLPPALVMEHAFAEALQMERHLVAKSRACEMEVQETREEMKNILQELDSTRKELEETRKELEDTRKQLELLRLSSGV